MATKMDERGVLVQCASCGARNRLLFTALDKRSRCGECKKELPPVSRPVEIGSSRQFKALIGEASLPVLVDFWAEWCGPCKMVAPELEKVAAASAGEAVIAKVNTEEVPEIAAEFQIASIPNLVLFKGGRETGRLAGARPASVIARFVKDAR